MDGVNDRVLWMENAISHKEGLSVQLSDLVVDFIRDENDIWYLIQVSREENSIAYYNIVSHHHELILLLNADQRVPRECLDQGKHPAVAGGEGRGLRRGRPRAPSRSRGRREQRAQRGYQASSGKYLLHIVFITPPSIVEYLL